MVRHRQPTRIGGQCVARIRKRLPGACAALGLLAAALVGATAAEASYPGGDGMIAWASRGLQGDVGYGIVSYSIIVANPDGSNPHPITVNDGTTALQDLSATWSPDGNRLAIWTCDDGLFGCNRSNGIDIINWDGSGRRHLVSDAKMPTWSPDGTKLVYLGDPDSDFSRWWSLYVINADGTGKARIPVSAPNACAFGGVWWANTPGGPKIAYKIMCPFAGVSWQLRLASPDGSDQTTLISSFAGDANRFDWSPDGTKIAYDMGVGWVQDLYEYTIATGQQRNLTNTPRVDPGGYGTESGAAYSPTGTRLIWEGDPRGTNLYKDLYLADANASGATPITDNGWDDALPSWQPCIAGATISCSPPVDPDADGDGVPDASDSCPNQPGPPSNNGCPVSQPPPDTDGDGVPDASDSCPNQPGPPSNNGCPVSQPPPDTDGDGVPDASDSCPNQPGPPSNNGCPVSQPPPDTDGDGVPDASDSCPNQPGPASNNGGCPVSVTPADGDHDGVPDAVDACPGLAAPGQPFGCPAQIGPDTVGPVLVLPDSDRRLVASRSGRVRFRIGPSAETASGQLVLKSAGKLRVSTNARPKVLALGTKPFDVAAGQSVVVKMTLPKAARKLLRRVGRIRAQATITLRDAHDNPTTERYTCSIRR